MRQRLDERQWRTYAAVEAKVIGRGGVSQVAAATGLARGTIMAGMLELEGKANEFLGVGGCDPARKSGCEAALLMDQSGESVAVALLR